jgi:DNA-directed RNA polymerase specialized sigma24 family protein
VGTLLGISEGTVKSLLSRAIKKLQRALDFYKNTLEMEVN